MKPTHAPARGLTLIELLVAITIFALLGLMSYRAIHAATESQARLSEEQADWQRIARALTRLESEFTQLGVRMQGQTATTPALRFAKATDGSKRLIYWRLDATLGARLTGIEWTNQRLELLRWKTSDPLQEPTRDALLEDVLAFDIHFVSKKSSVWMDTWPGEASRNAQLPAGIKVELEIKGKGRISRVFALR